MNLQETAWYLADKLKVIGYSISGSNKTSQCPHESELLSYAEKRLSPERRAKLERHMGRCDDCRESLALFARISGEEMESVEPIDPSKSDELIRRQTDRVLAFIALDEENQLPPRPRREPVRPERSGFSLSYAQFGFVATLVIVAAVAINYNYPTTDSAEAEVEEFLAGTGRRIPPPLSGGSKHSLNPVIRGDGKNDEINDAELLFDSAIDTLKFAKNPSAPTSARQLLARVYLARNEPGDPRLALEILQELSTREDTTPELWYYLGVAYYQSKRFDEAITAYSKAIEEKPDYEDAWFSRGLAHKDARNYFAARKDFGQFIKLSSDDNWKREADEWLKNL